MLDLSSMAQKHKSVFAVLLSGSSWQDTAHAMMLLSLILISWNLVKLRNMQSYAHRHNKLSVPLGDHSTHSIRSK